MNEKVKIFILNSLKPIDDTRAYHKIGLSLAQTNKYAINIIGFPAKKIPTSEKINFFPLQQFSRFGFERILLPFKVLRILIKEKPKLVISCTPEYLLVTCMYKILFGCKLIYDVQENYELNLKSDPSTKLIQKAAMYLYLGLSQRISASFIDHFFLAEEIYKNQLSFIKEAKFSFLLNKSVTTTSKSLAKNRKPSEIRFCITGTLGENYGTFEGISFFTKWKEQFANSTLIIMGYCADNEYYKLITKSIDGNDSIINRVSKFPLAHESIINELKASSVALLPYKSKKSIAGKIPTKFYDCARLQTIIMTTPDPNREAFLHQYQAGFTVDFNTSMSISTIADRLKHQKFYPNEISTDELCWKDSEEQKLLGVVSNLLKLD